MKFVDLSGLEYFLSKLKTFFLQKSEFEAHVYEHAPNNAEENIIVGIQLNNEDLIVDENKKVNISLVPILTIEGTQEFIESTENTESTE